MIKTILLTATLFTTLTAPGLARTLQVPAKNPVATVTIPDKWEREEIEFGYSGTSPDHGVFFSVEYASGARVDNMLNLTDEWLKENKIKLTSKATEQDVTIGGLAAKVMTAPATDADGPTNIDFVFIPAGDHRLIMLTLWGSDEERKANSADLDIIRSSVKSIK